MSCTALERATLGVQNRREPDGEVHRDQNTTRRGTGLHQHHIQTPMQRAHKPIRSSVFFFFSKNVRVENLPHSNYLTKGSMLTYFVLAILLHVAVPIQLRASSRASRFPRHLKSSSKCGEIFFKERQDIDCQFDAPVWHQTRFFPVLARVLAHGKIGGLLGVPWFSGFSASRL